MGQGRTFLFFLLVAVCSCTKRGEETRQAGNEGSRREPPRGTAVKTTPPAEDEKKSEQPQADENRLEQVKGTAVRIVPPPGFVPAPRFPGYMQESTNASIMVTEMPAPFSELTAGFSDPAAMKKQRMTLLDKRAVTVDGHGGLLLNVKQSAYGTMFLKWVLVLGDEKKSVMVVANFPQDYEARLSKNLKTSLSTVRWEKDKPLSPAEGLRFTVQEYGNLKRVPTMSNTLAFSRDGVFPSKSPDDPIFVAAPSLSKLPIQDKGSFATERVRSSVGIEGTVIEEITEVTIDDLEGYEVLAKGKHAESGNPVVVYQTILFDDPDYYIMQGRTSERNAENCVPSFKKMARTFKRKGPSEQ